MRVTASSRRGPGGFRSSTRAASMKPVCALTRRERRRARGGRRAVERLPVPERRRRPRRPPRLPFTRARRLSRRPRSTTEAAPEITDDALTATTLSMFRSHRRWALRRGGRRRCAGPIVGASSTKVIGRGGGRGAAARRGRGFDSGSGLRRALVRAVRAGLGVEHASVAGPRHHAPFGNVALSSPAIGNLLRGASDAAAQNDRARLRRGRRLGDIEGRFEKEGRDR